MRVLLLAPQDTPPPSLEEQHRWAELGSPLRTARLEEEHALALALYMRDGGPLAPMLACRQGSPLHRRAAALNLPVLPLPGANPANPVTLFRLWRWQRRHPRLLVQTVSEEALALGRRLLRLRPRGSTLLAHAFWQRPPLAPPGAALDAVHKILCGSGYIRSRLAAAQEARRGAVRPRLRPLPLAGSRCVVLAPGMVLEPEGPAAAPSAAAPEARFIFGLGDALTPRSGAQIVARAMAAIWQREDLPPWEVRALGGGPRYQELLDEAVTLGVAARLCLLNEQPLARILPACRAWIAPGASPEELPETLWAGAAAGLPVICTRTPLHLERLDAARLHPDAAEAERPPAACAQASAEAGAGAPALLVPPEDPQSLAKAMIDVMTDAGLRRSLAAASAALRPLVGLDAFAARTCRRYAAWGRELGWLPPDAPAEERT